MAEEKKKYFPMLPIAHWWNLREKFKQSIPGVVTDNYLASALKTTAKSARQNILPYLKDIGLIDEEGRTQELAKVWRDDHEYSDVCMEILESIYPEELRSAISAPNEEREAVERWFANQTGTGVSAVRRMAAFYIVLSEGDVSKKPEKKEPKIPKKKEAGPGTQDRPTSTVGTETKTEPSKQQILAPPWAPGVNINLEIHISSDATPDQIDKIFESMAKHIYKK